MDADDDYFRYPVGSPEHYAAYKRYFHSMDGIGFVFRGDPELTGCPRSPAPTGKSGRDKHKQNGARHREPGRLPLGVGDQGVRRDPPQAHRSTESAN